MKVQLERVTPNLKAIERWVNVWASLTADSPMSKATSTRQKRKPKPPDKRAAAHATITKSSRKRGETAPRSADPRCDLFNAAYRHMSDCIDSIYKALTKTDSSGTGGVAFLSLEDADVSLQATPLTSGTLSQWGQVQRDAARQAIHRDGATLWRGENHGGLGATVCDSQVRTSLALLTPAFIPHLSLCSTRSTLRSMPPMCPSLLATSGPRRSRMCNF